MGTRRGQPIGTIRASTPTVREGMMKMFSLGCRLRAGAMLDVMQFAPVCVVSLPQEAGICRGRDVRPTTLGNPAGALPRGAGAGRPGVVRFGDDIEVPT